MSLKPTAVASLATAHDPRQLLEATYALVLAGGRGTRLMELTDHVSKPAVAFGGHLRIVDYALSNCLNSGLRRVGVLTQYKAQSLIRHISQQWAIPDPRRATGIEVIPAQQQRGEDWYVGTADAVRQNLQAVREFGARHVLVLSGDHVYRMDYRTMVAEHARRGADATLATVTVPAREGGGLGIVDVDGDGRVRGFHEKPDRPEALAGTSGTLRANMGVYVFDAEFLCRELERAPADDAMECDFGRDLLPRIVRSARVLAHDFERSCIRRPGQDAYWRDVGTLDAYWQANMDGLRPAGRFDDDDPAWPIGSPHGSLAPARLSLALPEDAVSDCLVAPGSVIDRATALRSILFQRARVEAGARVEDSLLLPGSVVGRDTVLRRVIVGEGCVVLDGMKIGQRAGEDRAHFRVSEGGVTLVTAEMLGQHPVQHTDLLAGWVAPELLQAAS